LFEDSGSSKLPDRLVDDTSQFYADATIDTRSENAMKDSFVSGN
jgi:hypothetical protein